VADKNTQLLEDGNLSAKSRIDRFLFDDLFKSRGDNFFRDGTPPEEEQIVDNFLKLEQGDHKGNTFTKDGTIIIGESGAKFTAPVVVSAGCSIAFVNMVFEQTKENTEALVTINSGGRAVFQNCYFRRFPKTDREKVGTPSATASYIQLNTAIAAEQMATFTGCIFFESADSGATAVVTNIGTAVGTTFVGYSINKTATPMGAATLVGVIV